MNEMYTANQVRRKVVAFANRDLNMNLDPDRIRLRERSGKICIKLSKIYREKSMKS